MKEELVQKRVVAWLKKQKIWYMKVHGGPYQMAGVPDLMIIYHGQAIFVELKATGKKPTRLQAAVMSELARAGAIVFWGDDPDIIIRELQERFRNLDSLL